MFIRYLPTTYLTNFVFHLYLFISKFSLYRYVLLKYTICILYETSILLHGRCVFVYLAKKFGIPAIKFFKKNKNFLFYYRNISQLTLCWPTLLLSKLMLKLPSLLRLPPFLRSGWLSASLLQSHIMKFVNFTEFFGKYILREKKFHEINLPGIFLRCLTSSAA